MVEAPFGSLEVVVVKLTSKVSKGVVEEVDSVVVSDVVGTDGIVLLVTIRFTCRGK